MSRRAPLPSQLALARVRRGRARRSADRRLRAAELRAADAGALGRQRSRRYTGWRDPLRADAEHATKRRCASRDAPVRWLTAEQSNSSLIVGDAVMLKLFRRCPPAMHPEAEMGRYLTETQGFANTPALLGEIVSVATGRASACAGRRAGLHAQPGRCLDLDARPAQRARSTTSSTRDEAATRARRTTIARLHRHCAAMIGRRLGEHARGAVRDADGRSGLRAASRDATTIVELGATGARRMLDARVRRFARAAASRAERGRPEADRHGAAGATRGADRARLRALGRDRRAAR